MTVTTYGADGSVTTSPSPSQSPTSQTMSAPRSGSSIADRLSSLGSAYNTAMSNYNQTGDRSYLDAATGYHQTANLLRSQNGMQTYYDSITDNPGTGTTGTTSGGGSIAGQMLSAATNPQMTHWNVGGVTFDTPVGDKTTSYNGRSVTSMANLASSLGIQYSKDPSTGAIKVNGQVVNPVGYDSSGSPIVQVRQVLTAMGVPDQNIQYDQKTGNVSVEIPQQPQQPVQPPVQPQLIPYMQPQQIPDYMGGLTSQMPQAPTLYPFQAPDLSSYYSQLMPYQSFNPNWGNYFNQAHAQFDPTTNQQVSDLMTKQSSDIKSSDEKMNQRGIFDSGIAQSVEDDLRAKTSNAIAKVFTAAQANIEKQAQQLYTDAYDQWYKGNDLALNNNKMILDQITAQQKQAFDNWLNTQKLSLDQYNYAMNAWDKMSTLVQKNVEMQMNNQLGYDKINTQVATNNANNALQMYKFNNLSADQQANLSEKQFEFNNLSANQKAQLAWDNYKFNNVSATDQSTMAEKQREFNNLSADQKAQLAWKQYTFSNLSADQNATLTLDSNKLTAQIHQWATSNQLKSAQIGLDQQKLQEKSQVDQAMIDKASRSAQNDSDKTQLEGLKSQLVSVTDQIKAYQTAGKEPPTDLVTKYNTIMNSVDSITSKSSFTSEPGPTRQDVGNDLPGFNDGSGGGGYQTAYNATKQALADEGMPQSWLQPMLWIAQHESDYDPNNQNNTSTAYGLYQFLDGTWGDTGISKTSDPVMQARAAVRYIKQRYGDAQNAMDFWQQNQWY